MSGETQLTLTGSEMDIDAVTCEKYGGKHQRQKAEYVVEVLDTTLGEEIEVRCCESCKDEFADWVGFETAVLVGVGLVVLASGDSA